MTTSNTETLDFLAAGTVEDIAALIEACEFPQDAYFLAEQLPQHVIAQEQRQELLQFARVSDLKKKNDSMSSHGAKIDPALYTSGRIFCQKFELRWNYNQRTRETQVVYLGEEERTLPDLKPAKNLDSLRTELRALEKKAKSGHYYLFGTTLDTSLNGERIQQMGLVEEQRDADWRYYAEVRIPRLLRYPKPDNAGNKRRVRLVVCEYFERGTGSVRLFRFQKLEAAE